MTTTAADPTARLLGADLRRDDVEAVRIGEQAWRWAELGDRVDRVAAGLAAEGVEAGQRIAFLDKNSAACLEVAYGGARLGAVTTVVNWRLAPEEWHYVLDDSQAVLLFAGHEFAEAAGQLRDRLPHLKRIVVVGADADEYEDWLAAQEPRQSGSDASPDDVVLQLYTSGTTGFPKGVMLTHRNVAAHNAAAVKVVAPSEDTVAMVPMPLYHVGGLAYALWNLAAGARIVLVRDAVPSVLLDTIEQQGVTDTFIVPALIGALLQDPSIDGRDFSRLRHLLYGASPMPGPLMQACLQRFPGILGQVYGMTELSGAVSYLAPEDHADASHPERLLSAGRPYPGVEVRVVDTEGRSLGAGELGELWVRSRQCMAGYWRKPEATAETLVEDGWLRTGDVARVDDGGFVYLEDRLKDMVISGGENVYPAEVERVLVQHPSVADVAVIGVPDEKWGETVKAVVVPAPGATVDADELIAHCRQHLAGYKRPTSVDVLEALPRNATGKVLRRELRAPYWEGRHRQV
jgi:acyl-CoA synthetase (AMP-forming)/AMP-acid ligase II